MERDDWRFPWSQGWPEVDRRMVKTCGIALEKMIENAGRALAMGVAVVEEPPEGADLILDGLVGYSLSGVPMGRVADIMVWANGSGKPILALPKRDLTDPGVQWAVGDLYLADISVPPMLYFGTACPILTPSFAGEDKHVHHVFKTQLWRSALQLDTDDMLHPVALQ